ncbi:MAG TPA: aspartyl protease family protein [candidate division Zixibacteria bacterium]|nr:aspartyl protease family protein [candidate division Zixibacteria bacterium]
MARRSSPRLKRPYGAVLLTACLFAAAGATPARPQEKAGEIRLFAAPDENSEVVASIGKAESLAPVAETLGAGGVRWFLVRSKAGETGWIKAGSAEASKTEQFFRSLPVEPIVIGPPPTSANAPAPGSFVVPVMTTASSVLVQATLNNSVSAYLILDTGATGTMISSRIARQLALHNVGMMTGYSVAGPVTRPVARLSSLKIGDAEVRDLLVSIHDFHPNPRIEGLLGLDFLSRFHISLDARKKLLVLTPR